MLHTNPVGKAQKKVLDALGVTNITTYQDAEAYFKQIGILVTPVRVGRASEPSIKLIQGGGWSMGGDYELGAGPALTPEQREAIKQWMSN